VQSAVLFLGILSLGCALRDVLSRAGERIEELVRKVDLVEKLMGAPP
jgi:hypothetical protein